MIRRDEIPTLALLAATYVGFAGLTLLADVLPMLLVLAGLAVIVAQHSSLQHEVLHGHPFRNQTLSDATVFPALGLFLPYIRFKDTHLAHHRDPNLTDPYDDPESNFLDPLVWDAMPWWAQRLAVFNNTLLGRMVVGPAIAMLAFYRDDWRAIRQGHRRIVFAYMHHLGGLALVLIWVIGFTSLPLWVMVTAGYLGMSLLKIRTYLEHQAETRAAARSVIIEDRGPLALLFLNNNYHAVHHAHPQVVWHKLPQAFSARRHSFLRRNGGYTFRSYGQIFGQYFLSVKDPVAHPFWSTANRTTSKAPRP